MLRLRTPAPFFLSALFFLAIVFAATSPTRAIAGAERAWEAASPALYKVAPTWPGYGRPGFGAPLGTAPEGTAVAVFRPGLLATAAHVVARASEVHVVAPDGTRLRADVLVVDIETDLAFLEIAAETRPIALAPARPVTGADVCALGNAFGLGIGITCGIVSGARRAGIGFNRVEDFIQTDAAVNPGASGGALVDREGRLVGLLSAIFTKDSDANIGVNFAVSLDLLRQRRALLLP